CRAAARPGPPGCAAMAMAPGNGVARGKGGHGRGWSRWPRSLPARLSPWLRRCRATGRDTFAAAATVAWPCTNGHYRDLYRCDRAGRTGLRDAALAKIACRRLAA